MSLCLSGHVNGSSWTLTKTKIGNTEEYDNSRLLGEVPIYRNDIINIVTSNMAVITNNVQKCLVRGQKL